MILFPSKGSTESYPGGTRTSGLIMCEDSWLACGNGASAFACAGLHLCQASVQWVGRPLGSYFMSQHYQFRHTCGRTFFSERIPWVDRDHVKNIRETWITQHILDATTASPASCASRVSSPAKIAVLTAGEQRHNSTRAVRKVKTKREDIKEPIQGLAVAHSTGEVDLDVARRGEGGRSESYAVCMYLAWWIWL